jgi:hypothetical protein
MWICWRDMGVPSSFFSPVYLSLIFFLLQVVVFMFVFKYRWYCKLLLSEMRVTT